MTIIKIRYSIEPRHRIYVKRYEFLFFPKNMSNNYSQKILDFVKKSTKGEIEIASERAIQKAT